MLSRTRAHWIRASALLACTAWLGACGWESPQQGDLDLDRPDSQPQMDGGADGDTSDADAEPADVTDGGAVDGGDPDTDARDAGDALVDAGQDSATDPSVDASDAAGDSGAPYAGPPSVRLLYPRVALPGSLLYLEGDHLMARDGSAAQTHVFALGVTVHKQPYRRELVILESGQNRLTCEVPPDLHRIVEGAARVAVQTPLGEALAPEAIVFAESLALVADWVAGPGEGLLAYVYSLDVDASELPDFERACLPVTDGGDPHVLKSPCPVTSLLMPTADVPERSFTEGFPGLMGHFTEWFAIEMRGYLLVEEPGLYTFRLCSDDGSALLLGESKTRLIDLDGVHLLECSPTVPVQLGAGLHPLSLQYFQGPRECIGLQLFWTVPGYAESIIPPHNLRLFPE